MQSSKRRQKGNLTQKGRVSGLIEERISRKQLLEENSKLRKRFNLVLLLFFGLTTPMITIAAAFTYNYQNSVGTYYQFMDFVVIKGQDNLNQMLFTCAHETGHYVYFEIMNETQRLEWDSISEHSTTFATPYAKKNSKEDFAESFASMFTCELNGNDLYEVSPVKEIFMEKISIDTNFSKRLEK